MCVHVRMEARHHLKVSFLRSHPCYFSETGSPTGVGFTDSARLVAQQAPNIFLSLLTPHLWEYKHLSSPEPYQSPSPWYSMTSIKTTLKDLADITWQRNKENKVIEIKM